jgi:hypothetical protein
MVNAGAVFVGIFASAEKSTPITVADTATDSQ